MTFQERVIERFKEFFPNAEIVYTVKDWSIGQSVAFGMAEEKNEGDRFLHSAIREQKNEFSGNDYNAEEILISVRLDDLYFYRAPERIYIRLIDSSNDKSEAIARFSLGYKA